MAQYKPAKLLRALAPRSSIVSKVVQRRAVSALSSRVQTVENPHDRLVDHAPELRTVQTHSYSSLARQPRPEVTVESVSIDPSRKSCYIKWIDGFESQFHSVWLRHNCHCKECRHPNGQKLMDSTSVSCSLSIESAFVEGDTLLVTWAGAASDHAGEIPISFLRANNYNKETMLEKRQAAKCNPVSDFPTVKYDDITNSNDWLLKWIQQINEDGISLVQGVPSEDNMTQKVAELIGPMMSTIYGTVSVTSKTTFDVEKTTDPINVAYSTLPIELHQDLVYYESPPGLQLLHCMQFDDCVEGGGSTFLDAFDMADQFRITHPDLFQTLTTVPATFQKVHYNRDLPVHIVNQKPHFKLNHLGELIAVYWSPPFEGALSVAGEDVERYFLAYETFAKLLESSKKLRRRLRPGELVVFNNLRMLHGREGFTTNGGARKLKGCYVNIDIFKSRAQVMNNFLGDGRLAKRVGNQCYF